MPTAPAETGSTTRRIAPCVVAAALVIAAAAVFLHSSQERAGVLLSSPLDDTFIHFQYAKQLARGRVLQFNDGDSPTTGATSVLYLLLLAPGWLVGFRGLDLLIWAWTINGGLHLAGGLAVFSCVRRSTGQRPLAWTALLAFMLNGPLLWGVFSNMEIALFSTVLLLVLRSAIALDASPEGAGATCAAPLLWGSLLALCRPEGALLAGGLTIWLLWRHLAALSGAPRRQRLRGAPRLCVPLAVGAAVVLLFFALTGRLGTNANLKSHLELLPDEAGRYIETTLGWVPMALQILMEKWPGPLAPLAALAIVGGLAGWAASGDLRRPGPGALVLLWLCLLTLFYAFVFARRDHFDRYYLPYLGLTVVAMWWLLGRIGAAWPSVRAAPVLASAMLLVFMVPHTRSWAARFGDNCRDLAKQHFEVAKWVREHTPATSRIAVNDAGAIPYLAERYTYDIVGLGSNAFYRLKKVIPFCDAPAWEALEDLADRPDYMVAYPEWIREMHAFRIFEPLARFPLKDRTMVANETKIVWKMRWDLLADGHSVPPDMMQGRTIADRLDVANVESERAHQYRRLDRGVARGAVHEQAVGPGVIIDGGRLVERGERFALRAAPGRAGVLLLRTRGPAILDVDVRTEGRRALRWRARAGAGFSTARLEIPAAWMRSGQLALEIEARRPYQTFHYWLLQ